MTRNITLSADERTIEKARLRAAQEGKSLNKAFQEWLAEWTGDGNPYNDFDAVMAQLQGVSLGGPWSRDEMTSREITQPEFANEADEAQFWQSTDSTDYVDWSKATPVTFSNLQPSLKSISLRLPEPMLARLKSLANERDVPYQSLIKMILADHLSRS